MSKRKAGVNDIIYELDNDDIEISSEDEAKEAKIHRLEAPKASKSQEVEIGSLENGTEVINLDSTTEGDCVIVSPTKTQNGGKTSPDVTVVETIIEFRSDSESPKQTEELDSNRKVKSDCPKTTIFNEDIVIDSPASYSDLGVVGCENRTPLVTVRFRDKKMAKSYKEKVKAFMLSLIKLHDEDNLTGSETETDLELDVWPEDLQDDTDESKKEADNLFFVNPAPVWQANRQGDIQYPKEATDNLFFVGPAPVWQESLQDNIQDPKEEADNLFFVDTAPGDTDTMKEVPTYRQNSTLISNIPDKEPTPPPIFRRGPSCFNCDGAHAVRDCTLPRNNMKIAERRKNMVKMGRYHVEDDQKYGHLVPGRISGQLRHALGLNRHELPTFIYRMRMLGYPPGWLEEARISHSGITMFDSTGRAILDPEEEEGEVCEPGSKDKFDIRKILDFPGFNVLPSSRYKDEAHRFGLPPMSEQDSKMAMLQMLAPNAMKAYKRKKLSIFPSSSNNNSIQEGQAEMELDSGDETAEFPSVPPLPDEAPPPPPPPPASPPPLPPGIDEPSDGDKSADDLEVLEVIQVNDIPVPDDEVITTDGEEDEKSTGQIDSGRESPSLDDLEEKKRRLLDALKGDVITLDVSASNAGETEPETDSKSNTENDKLSEIGDDKEDTNDNESATKIADESTPSKSKSDVLPSKSDDNTPDLAQTPKASTSDNKATDVAVTPTEKAGHVKSSEFGTPVMNIASSFKKLPTDVNFAKDICDIINFENLPNSIGKYKQISMLLKKVKSEVDRIQDS